MESILDEIRESIMGTAGKVFVVLTFVGLFVLALVGRLHLWPDDPAPNIEADFESKGRNSLTLFVFVPGLDRDKFWPCMRPQLASHGDTVILSYPNALCSNADPVRVATRIAGEIQTQFARAHSSRTAEREVSGGHNGPAQAMLDPEGG